MISEHDVGVTFTFINQYCNRCSYERCNMFIIFAAIEKVANRGEGNNYKYEGLDGV